MKEEGNEAFAKVYSEVRNKYTAPLLFSESTTASLTGIIVTGHPGGILTKRTGGL